MVTEPEIVGRAYPLAGNYPTLGEVLRVRQAIDVALAKARDLMPLIWKVQNAAEGLGYHLLRLEENAAGYFSDYQQTEIDKLLDGMEEAKIVESIPEQAATWDWAASLPSVAPLAAAVDKVDREIVAHEAATVPVQERGGGATVAEAALALGGLAFLAWVLS